MNIDFLIDNYIWFVVVLVVIIMTIIGYYAEKTNFGKNVKVKPKKTKKGKKKKDDFFEGETDDLSMEANTNGNYVSDKIDAIDGLTTDFIKEEKPAVEEIKENYQELKTFKDEEPETIHVEPSAADVKEEVIPLTDSIDVATPIGNESKNVDYIIDEPKPSIDTSDIVNVDNIDEKKEVVDDIPLPNIDSLAQTNETDEDDVWNF